MLYRIDVQHFLTHAIDYFSREELLHFKYLIISGTVANLSKQDNVTKRVQLYPTTEIIEEYVRTKNRKVMEEMYTDLLCANPSKGVRTYPDDDKDWVEDLMYLSIVNPVLHHQDIVIVCDREENDYIDVLCKVIKKRFSLECIDLNKLFSDGEIGPLYIDRDKIHDKAVEIRKRAIKKEVENIASTADGRLSLLQKMNTKEKIKKLKELGITVKGSDRGRLNDLLIDAWVNDERE